MRIIVLALFVLACTGDEADKRHNPSMTGYQLEYKLSYSGTEQIDVRLDGHPRSPTVSRADGNVYEFSIEGASAADLAASPHVVSVQLGTMDAPLEIEMTPRYCLGMTEVIREVAQIDILRAAEDDLPTWRLSCRQCSLGAQIATECVTYE